MPQLLILPHGEACREANNLCSVTGGEIYYLNLNLNTEEIRLQHFDEMRQYLTCWF